MLFLASFCVPEVLDFIEKIENIISELMYYPWNSDDATDSLGHTCLKEGCVVRRSWGICSPKTSSWWNQSGQHGALSLPPSLPWVMRQASSLLGFSWKCQGCRIGGCADCGPALLATCELQLPGDFNWQAGREGGGRREDTLILKSTTTLSHNTAVGLERM